MELAALVTEALLASAEGAEVLGRLRDDVVEDLEVDAAGACCIAFELASLQWLRLEYSYACQPCPCLSIVVNLVSSYHQILSLGVCTNHLAASISLELWARPGAVKVRLDRHVAC